MFGVPPPNPDPQLEGDFQRTPKERLESYAFGFITIAVLLVIAVVVMSIV